MKLEVHRDWMPDKKCWLYSGLYNGLYYSAYIDLGFEHKFRPIAVIACRRYNKINGSIIYKNRKHLRSKR